MVMKERAMSMHASKTIAWEERRLSPSPGWMSITRDRRSSHPFITRISLPCSLLLPLLIASLLFLLLGTAPLPVIALFLIHLALVICGALVWGGLVDV
jgi:hypothetical protein